MKMKATVISVILALSTTSATAQSLESMLSEMNLDSMQNLNIETIDTLGLTGEADLESAISMLNAFLPRDLGSGILLKHASVDEQNIILDADYDESLMTVKKIAAAPKLFKSALKKRLDQITGAEIIKSLIVVMDKGIVVNLYGTGSKEAVVVALSASEIKEMAE